MRNHMLRATLASLSLLVATILFPSVAQADDHAPSRAMLDKYCVTCHSERLQTGGLVLENLDMASLFADGEVWEKVLRKLGAGQMPPAGMPRPDQATKAAFVASLEGALADEAEAAQNPGRKSGIHRLNRVEYTNAIRDLLALEINGREMLPPDDSGYGFDNIAAALTVTAGLLERYLITAQQISRMAIGDAAMRPVGTTYAMSFFELQDQRMSEDLPFGSRGGLSVNHYFPVDGDYDLQIRLQRSVVNLGGGIRGLDEVEHIDVRLDDKLVRRFTLGGGDDEQDGDTRGPYTETELERFADDELKLRFPAAAGTHKVGVTFVRQHWVQEGVGMERLPIQSYGFASSRKSGRDYGKIEMGVETVEVRGPYNASAPEATASRDKIFSCQPTTGPVKRSESEQSCAQDILGRLARQAYRRPVSDTDLTDLMEQFNAGNKEYGFEAGIQRGIERLLVDPRFLFRIEQDPENAKSGTPYRLSDLELASRLSFFLWSSLPDEELLSAAERGELNAPDVLEQQVRRMLADPKSNALVDGFFAQWLQQRKLPGVDPDLHAFPEFDENLRAAFQQETDLFLKTQLRDDRSILELLTADYTFVNERLAKHYGIPKVYGTHFRRVDLPNDQRAGLLGQGSILLVTSYANRTSPVQRGKWLLENVLGAHAPEPPADVPPFPEATEGSLPTSIRARMEQHRQNPVCASCHAQMDPLGFALENFDAIGQWRTIDAGEDIDASGQLPNGAKFGGPAAFRAALLDQRHLFLGTVTEKLLTYALGRGVEYYDMPIVRKIARDSEADDARWSSLILGIVKSMPFQMRRSL